MTVVTERFDILPGGGLDRLRRILYRQQMQRFATGCHHARWIHRTGWKKEGTP